VQALPVDGSLTLPKWLLSKYVWVFLFAGHGAVLCTLLFGPSCLTLPVRFALAPTATVPHTAS
jgi:hypothetical protein